jgi:Ca-activated chloride channel family protein
VTALLGATLLVAQFSAGVDLVDVYASVTTRDGQPVAALQAEDFVVLEDGVEQPIQTFARGDFPLSVVLAIDRSFSMAGAPLRLAREAATTFLSELRSEDQALVVAIGSEVEPIGELSRDREAQREALKSLLPWGTTSLHDAIVDVLARVAEGVGRRAVVALSDGLDRYSTATAAQVIDRARANDALVYGIALGERPSSLFAELATVTGGAAFHVRRPEQLPGIFSRIGHELRTQYLIGYAPPAGRPGWRTIEVRVKRPDVIVRARSGYAAP